ncbi:MAG: hypothetical protein GXO90_06750 [FCB group bacterium]|nr:hypothetical protein [FCB group bacterium]
MKNINSLIIPLLFLLAACSSPDGGLLSSDPGLRSSAPVSVASAKTTYQLAGQIQSAPAGTQIVHADSSVQTAVVGDDVYINESVKNTVGSAYKVDLNGNLIIESDPTIAVTITSPVSVDYYYHQDWVAVNQDMTVYTSQIRVGVNGSCTLTTKATLVLRSGFNENE